MYRNTALLISIMLMWPFIGSSQDYSVSLIPDSLKENAHAVIRQYDKELELQNTNTGIERIKKVVTVLDESGADFANISISYDRNEKVNIKSAAIYDKNGKRLKKIYQSDFSDVSAGDGELYSDERMKTYKVGFGDYPYTAEFVYEVSHSNMISYGSWFPVFGYNISMEHSLFTFVHPSDLAFRKKELNLKNHSDIISQGSRTIETWFANSIKSTEYEPFSISLTERLPRVMLMPVRLKYDEYSGSSATWEEYGKWIHGLYSGRDELPETVKIKLQELAGNTTDTIQKIKLLYKQLQENTRYVAIKLGIGGYQPFSAASVSSTGYGDCKALTNYMYAMLLAFGIKSWPALVSSGTYIENIYRDFPNFQQFDHVILCVPVKHDTIWLECTDQTIPFGFLGDFTDNRDVLLITDEGGRIAHTRKYGPDENIMNTRADISISPSGEADCKIRSKYTGLQFYDILELFSENKEDQRKWILKNSGLPSLQVTGFEIKRIIMDSPEGVIEKSVKSKDYCSASGSYLIMPVNLVDAQVPIRKPVKERKSDFIIQRSTIDLDTITYIIPPAFKIESAPAGKSIKSQFGEYNYSLKVEGNRILYVRRLEIREGKFSPSLFRSFYDFILSVSRADNDKVMLSKT
jgi:hypothetical protein